MSSLHLESRDRNGLFLEFLVTIVFISCLLYLKSPFVGLLVLFLSVYYSTQLNQNNLRFESHLNPLVTVGKIIKEMLNNNFDAYYLLLIVSQVAGCVVAGVVTYYIESGC